MKYYLFLLALLLAVPAAAQVSAVAPRPDTVASAAPDTVGALHRLFAHKRHNEALIVGGTLVATAGGVAVVGATVKSGGFIDAQAVGQVVVTFLGVVVSGAELLFFIQYNQRHEQRAIAAFEAHQLPRHLRRQLRGRYFEPTGSPPLSHR